MNRLAGRKFWDARHKQSGADGDIAAPVREGRLRRLFRKARARVGATPAQSYADFLFEKLLQAYLPAHRDWAAIEIGCAPGTNLLMLHQLFGYQPWGVEYSPVGAATSRRVFAQHGFDPASVIEADLFDPSFQEQHRGRFSVVLSLGFIEHFATAGDVLAAHMALLKTGGYLVCAIPNLRSYGYPFLAVFARDLLHAHNTSIMRLPAFRALFDNLGFQTRFCGYCGLYQFFGMSLRKERSLRGLIAKAMDRLSNLFDHALFLGLRGRTVETRLSPRLVFIGQRKS